MDSSFRWNDRNTHVLEFRNLGYRSVVDLTRLSLNQMQRNTHVLSFVI